MPPRHAHQGQLLDSAFCDKQSLQRRLDVAHDGLLMSGLVLRSMLCVGRRERATDTSLPVPAIKAHVGTPCCAVCMGHSWPR